MAAPRNEPGDGQAGLAGVTHNAATTYDFSNDDRAPLLFISGAVAKANDRIDEQTGDDRALNSSHFDDVNYHAASDDED